MSKERVVIDIEVNSDIATIEATRVALERLSGAEEDSDRSTRRSTRSTTSHSSALRTATKHTDALTDATRSAGRAAKNSKGRWDGFGKSVFNLRKDIGGLISIFGGLIKTVNKLSLIEIPLLIGGMGAIAALFKAGPFFINLYRAAMSSLATMAAGVGIALGTVAAAMREFQSVQFAPMYTDGGGNTMDRFAAASQAMKMFVDNANLAVAGSESLTKAFGILSKQAPVTAGTTRVFESLMNVVAGSGGDLGGGAQKLAEFMAKVQKSGLGAAGAEAKALGADFEAIIKEAKALGLDTQEEFFKAAAEGALGETFQKKYAGQLNALNNTLFARFKTAFSELKTIFIDFGEPFLQPVGEAVGRIQDIIQRTLMQLAPLLREFGVNGFINDIVGTIDKVATKFVFLMTKYLGTSPGLLDYFGKVFGGVADVFEKIQDWARQFEAAGDIINQKFIKPIFAGIADKFGGGMNVLADLVEANGPMLESLADTIVNLIAAIGEYGNMLKEAFFAAIPVINLVLKGVTKVFEIFTALANGLMRVFGGIGGGMGKALAAVPVLYASLVLFGRFFKSAGGFFGKDMSVKANTVHVHTPGGTMSYGRMGPYGGYSGGMFGFGDGSRGRIGRGMAGSASMGLFGRTRNAFMSNLLYGGGTVVDATRAARTAWARQGGLSSYAGQLRSRIANSGLNQMVGLGNIAGLAGGTALMGLGSNLGGYDTAGGTAANAAGLATNAYFMANMLGAKDLRLGAKLAGPAIGGGTLGRSALGSAGLAAYAGTAMASYAAGNYIGGKFGDDSIKSRGSAFATGAAAGAGIGTAIGTALSPFTAGISIPVVAAIGGVIGGVTALVKSGGQRRDARKAATGFVDTFVSDTEELFRSGNIEGLKEKMSSLNTEIEKAATGDIDYYFRKVNERKKEFDEVAMRIEIFDKNAAMAAQTLGLTTDGLNDIAGKAGIDATRRLLTFREMLKLTGRTAEDQAKLIKANFANLGGAALGGVLEQLRTIQDRPATMSALNAQQMRVLGGATSDADLAKLLETGLQYGTMEFGTLGGMASILKTMGIGGSAYEEGGSLAGMDDLAAQRLQQLVNQVMSPTAIMKSITNEQLMMFAGEAGLSNDLPTLRKQILAKLLADPSWFSKMESAFLMDDQTQINWTAGGISPTSVFATGGKAMPKAVEQPNTTNIQINVGANIKPDPALTKAITDAVLKAQRDATERGKTGGGGMDYAKNAEGGITG